MNYLRNEQCYKEFNTLKINLVPLIATKSPWLKLPHHKMNSLTLFLVAPSLLDPHYSAIAECANSDYEYVVMAFRSALSDLKYDPLTAIYANLMPNMLLMDLNTAAHIFNPAIPALIVA